MEPETVNQDEYNGWVNRETWAAALHLSNDEGIYSYCLELVEGKPTEGERRWSAGDAIESFVTDCVGQVLCPDADVSVPFRVAWSCFIADVGSLWRVDWAAVADSFLES